MSEQLAANNFDELNAAHNSSALFLANEYVLTGSVSDWTRNNYAAAAEAYNAHPIVAASCARAAARMAEWDAAHAA